MALLILIGLAQLGLLLLIWSSILELLSRQRSPEDVAFRAIRDMEMQTLRSMFQATRLSGDALKGRERRP